jgi:O-antigen/teichoic acid export membrane protein
LLEPDTLLGSVAVILLVNLVQRSVGFGRGILFCRWLDPEALGRWEMAYGFLLLAAPLAVLGLPGSFGRYLERFRTQRQLGSFLRRTTAWTVVLAIIAVSIIVSNNQGFAWLVFGDTARASLVVLVAGVLATVIAHHFLEALFAGLRLFRIVSAMHFVQSMTFAATSLALIAWYQASASSVVAAYGIACGISILGVLLWSRNRMISEFDPAPPVPHRHFWPPLVKFAVWVWVTNLLANLFAVIDRYMILHFSGLPADDSLVQVANYHASMIVPVLMISVANLLVGAITPHLSHDWEHARRDRVDAQLHSTLKSMLLGMTLLGFAVLALTPMLFHFVFAGKYDGGLRVMHWTVAGCVWFSVLLVAQVYAWIAEKTRQAALPLAAGIATNVALNFLLLPKFGLLGAVVATALATLLALVLQLLVNLRLGMKLDGGTMVLAGMPLLLVLPPSSAAIGLCLYGVMLSGPGLVVREAEWSSLRSILDRQLDRLRELRSYAHR